MSTERQASETLVVDWLDRECERCHTEVPEDNLMLVLHPESYGVAGSPTSYELVCLTCLVKDDALGDTDVPF